MKKMIMRAGVIRWVHAGSVRFSMCHTKPYIPDTMVTEALAAWKGRNSRAIDFLHIMLGWDALEIVFALRPEEDAFTDLEV